MTKSYKVRIYPNKQQEELIQKTFGCCRFVYNYYLNKRIEMWKNTQTIFNYCDCCKDLTKLKQELEWLKEPDRGSLKYALRSLDTAYTRFFNEVSKFPQFKHKKSHRNCYTTESNCIHIENNYIRLPKLGFVKFRDKYDIQGRILNVTVIQVPSGKYYISVCCTDITHPLFSKTDKKIGLDLGIKDFAITSDGVKYGNPKYLDQSLKKIIRLQKELSRKTRGGSNWNKSRIRLAKEYEKITNQRKDFLRKITTELIKNYDLIFVEDLDITKMMKNNNSVMSRNISDVSWYEFVKQLQYKADWYGKKVVKIDRYFASSQICSCCGCKSNITKRISVRKWKCPNCNVILDRDINAVINILNEGLKQIN